MASRRDRSSQDRTWPESRGPHLPDALTALPIGAIVCLVLATVMTVLAVRGLLTAGVGDPFGWWTAIAGAIPTVVAFLIPAALFRRHPDAWQTDRLLVVGTLLFGVVELLQYTEAGLSPWFASIIPPTAATPFLVPLDVAYTVTVGLMGALAPFLTGRGLVAARAWEDAPRARSWWLLVAGLTFVAGVTNVLTLVNLGLDVPADAMVVYYWLTVLSVTVSLVGVFGWAYLAGATLVGWRSGEAPPRGWALAALGSGLILTGLAVSGVVSAIGVFATPLPNETATFILTAFALGYIALVAAFLTGLPASIEE